jgi:hypothetical protein
MVTVHVANGRGTVLGNPPQSFTSAEELVELLAAFVRRQEFEDTLEDLRAQARDPVDARLERANGMATLACSFASTRPEYGSMFAALP